jgi:hypothetical protein
METELENLLRMKVGGWGNGLGGNEAFGKMTKFRNWKINQV